MPNLNSDWYHQKEPVKRTPIACPHCNSDDSGVYVEDFEYLDAGSPIRCTKCNKVILPPRIEPTNGHM